MQKAIENYKKAAEQDPKPEMRKLALQYLVAAYGPDKLNEPEKAEPIVQKMIQLEPNEPTNYFALAKIYEDAGRYEEAEAALMKAKEVKPNDPLGLHDDLRASTTARATSRRRSRPQQAAELEPKNPQGYQLIATFYWEKAHKDHRLTPRSEGIHRRRACGDRQGARAEPRLRRGADLQEPAAADGRPTRRPTWRSARRSTNRPTTFATAPSI